MNMNTDLLERDDTLLMVVDIQKSMLAGCVGAGRVQANAGILLEAARLLDMPVLLTAQNPAKLGPFLPELSGKAPDSMIFSKNQFGCFENPAIREAVAAAGRRSILLAGIETHICIFQTGVGGVRMGYRIHVPVDVVSSTSQLNVEIGLERLKRAGAVATSLEMAIFELLRQADTDRFRSLLPLIKSIAR